MERNHGRDIATFNSHAGLLDGDAICESCDVLALHLVPSQPPEVRRILHQHHPPSASGTPPGGDTQGTVDPFHGPLLRYEFVGFSAAHEIQLLTHLFTVDRAAATLLAVWSEAISIPDWRTAPASPLRRMSPFCPIASHFVLSIRSSSQPEKPRIRCGERSAWASGAYRAR